MTSVLEAIFLAFLSAIMAIVMVLMAALALGPERAKRVGVVIARLLRELLRSKNDERC